jgi:hypothetical protein
MTRLYWTKMQATEPPNALGAVELFAADRPEDESPTEWISARVLVDDINVKSLALLQIAALSKARGLIVEEIRRLEGLYRASERSQR